MITINAGEVRIPREAREAVARRERVMVTRRGRPAFILAHPDDDLAGEGGRPLHEALDMLAAGPLPDPEFGRDMAAVLAAVGPVPDDPWPQP